MEVVEKDQQVLEDPWLLMGVLGYSTSWVKVYAGLVFLACAVFGTDRRPGARARQI